MDEFKEWAEAQKTAEQGINKVALAS